MDISHRVTFLVVIGLLGFQAHAFEDQNSIFITEMIEAAQENNSFSDGSINRIHRKKVHVPSGTLDFLESESGVRVIVAKRGDLHSKEDVWRDGREIQYNGIGSVIHIPLYHQKIICYQDVCSYEFTVLWRQDKKSITTPIVTKKQALSFLLDFQKVIIDCSDEKQTITLFFPRKRE